MPSKRVLFFAYGGKMAKMTAHDKLAQFTKRWHTKQNIAPLTPVQAVSTSRIFPQIPQYPLYLPSQDLTYT